MEYRWHMAEEGITVHAIRDESIGKHGVKRLVMLCGRKARPDEDKDVYWEGEDMAGVDLTQVQVQFPQGMTLVGTGDFTFLHEPCKRCLAIAVKPNA